MTRTLAILTWVASERPHVVLAAIAAVAFAATAVAIVCAVALVVMAP